MESVLQACPNIAWVMPGRTIRTWQDLVDAADGLQLGISPSAWAAAGTALGAGEAAVTLAAIYQRSDRIQSPGGYLESRGAREGGKFSAWQWSWRFCGPGWRKARGPHDVCPSAPCQLTRCVAETIPERTLPRQLDPTGLRHQPGLQGKESMWDYQLKPNDLTARNPYCYSIAL